MAVHDEDRGRAGELGVMLLIAHQQGHTVNVSAAAADVAAGAHLLGARQRRYSYGYRYIRRKAWNPLRLLPSPLRAS